MESFEPVNSVDSMEQLSSVASPQLVESDVHNPRLQRVFAYQTDALAEPHGLESNLASLNCGLMRMALLLEELIAREVDQGPVSEERLPMVFKAIDTHLRVARQVDRFAQVELRRTAAAESTRKRKVDIECWIENSPEPGSPESEDFKT